ncbi:GNAT family N-acetyltransferase [Fonticella tunisiensis]|uniref:GNAT family N-acetyltransferase n=1 Tax=Fonticella tunisiensis TaxID=1096341 RepID=UPI0014151F74|nr:GNAT family N-acetyltransferase [Fonticella tunisiensis]
MKNKIICGIVFINTSIREIYYLPVTNQIYFFSLMHILKKNFNLEGYIFKFTYKNGIKIDTYRKYFKFNIISNIKNMQCDIGKLNNIYSFPDDIRVRKLDISRKDEIYLRLELQNKVFGGKNGRQNLTIDEVIEEQKNPRFLRNMCFVLEINSVPAGYGQILIIDNLYHLVNFGVIPEFRRKGYGYYFLLGIIEECKKYEIEELYLTVDNMNHSAVNLYKKIGFKEIFNQAKIELKE